MPDGREGGAGVLQRVRRWAGLASGRQPWRGLEHAGTQRGRGQQVSWGDQKRGTTGEGMADADRSGAHEPACRGGPVGGTTVLGAGHLSGGTWWPSPTTASTVLSGQAPRAGGQAASRPPRAATEWGSLRLCGEGGCPWGDRGCASGGQVGARGPPVLPSRADTLTGSSCVLWNAERGSQPPRTSAAPPGPQVHGSGGKRAICFLSDGQSGLPLRCWGPALQVGSASQPAAPTCRDGQTTAALRLASTALPAVLTTPHGAGQPSLLKGSRSAPGGSRTAASRLTLHACWTGLGSLTGALLFLPQVAGKGASRRHPESQGLCPGQTGAAGLTQCPACPMGAPRPGPLGRWVCRPRVPGRGQTAVGPAGGAGWWWSTQSTTATRAPPTPC